MTKAVLITKIDPTYDDLPEERYHFPRTYLRQIEQAVGDWILYYEPRRRSADLASSGGRQAYFATARLTHILPDPTLSDHFYAIVEDFLEFDEPVPFKEEGHYFESSLRKNDGSTNKGAFGRAIRLIPDEEYDLILQAGFAHVLGFRERTRIADVPEAAPTPLGFGESQAYFEPETQPRRMVTQIIQRPFRDRAFSAAIKNAY